MKHHLYLQYGNTEIIIICIFSMGILKHHHLYIQYRNTESPSSVSTVCKYWNIIYIFSMGILKSSSSVSLVWEYWNIIISIFSIEILNHHHLHLQYHHLHLILYVEISDFYVLRRNIGLFVITTMVITYNHCSVHLQVKGTWYQLLNPYGFTT